MRKKLKIIEKDMTQVRFKGRMVWALCYYGKNLIEIEKTLKGKQRFVYYLHELLHWRYPNLTERQVSMGAREITEQLWKCGFRGKR